MIIENENIIMSEEFEKEMKNIHLHIYDKNVITTDPFYSHLLFDAYVKNSEGNHPENVTRIFLSHLDEIYNDSGNYFDQINKYREYLQNGINIIDYANIDNLNIGITNIDNILLFSGYKKNNNNGHSINIFISNKTIYVINSGDGIDYVEELCGYKNIDYKRGPVIIKYENNNDLEIQLIFYICLLMDSLDESNMDELISKNKINFSKNFYRTFINSLINTEIYEKLFEEYNKRFNHNIEINSKLLYNLITVALNKEPVVHKIDNYQISGSCSFYSSYYFIKYFLDFTENDFIKIINYIKNNTIEKYCKVLYNDYYITSDNYIKGDYKNMIRFYNNMEIIIKDYDFKNKDIILKLYNKIIKRPCNLNFYKTNIKYIFSFSEVLSDIQENFTFEKLFYIYDNYSSKKIIFFNFIIIYINKIINIDNYYDDLYKQQDKYKNELHYIYKLLLGIIHDYYFDNIIFLLLFKIIINMEKDYDSKENDTRLNYAIDNITNIIRNVITNDYFFNYIELINSVSKNIKNINIEKIFFPGIYDKDKIKVRDHANEYLYMYYVYSLEILGKFLNIINMINNGSIDNIYILNFVNIDMSNNSDNINILINYKILIIYNNSKLHELNDKEYFNNEVCIPKDSNDIFYNLNLILNMLDIEKYLKQKNTISEKFNDILISYLFCFKKIKKGDEIYKEFIEIILPKICLLDETVSYKNTLVYNILINSDKDEYILIFKILELYEIKINNSSYEIHVLEPDNKNNLMFDNHLRLFNKFTITGDIDNNIYYKKGSNYIKFFDNKEMNIKILNPYDKSSEIILTPVKYVNDVNNILLNKLNIACIKYFNFEYEEKYFYYDLLDYDNEYFCIYDNNTYFINDKNKYKVIFDINDTSLAIWIFNMHNSFIIEDDNKIKYILLFINNDTYFEDIFTDFSEFKFSKLNKYYILKLHYTNLFILNNDFTEMSALKISLVNSKNNICQYLINFHFKNLYLNSDITDNNNIYNEIIKTLYGVNKEKNIYKYNDVPYWALLENYNSFNNYNYKIRKEYLKIEETNIITDSFDLNKLKKTNEYIICENIIKKIKKQEIIIGNEFDENVKIFIKDFKYNCIDIEDIVDEINLSGIREHSDYFINLFLKKNIFNITNIYTSNYLLFYRMLIRKIFNDIKINFNNLLIKSQVLKNCAEFLKLFENLNSEIIYGFSNNRKMEDIVFELHSGIILRNIQKKNYIDKIYKDLENNEYNKMYQILMGIGKTSIITPIVILKDYFLNNKNNFYIILPEHLVKDSYNILLQFSNIINDFIINYREKINIENYNLNILSDFDYKIYLCNNSEKYIKKDMNNINNSLFILDEIDIMLDPLKSDLNIPKNPIDHPHNNIIIEFFIKLFLYDESTIEKYRDNNENFNNIINNNIIKIKTYLIKNKFKKNFGFGILNFKNPKSVYSFKDLENDKNFYIAIPYSGNDSPVNGSEFTDFELSIVLTIISYKQQKFREQDIILLFLEMYKFKNDIEVSQLIYQYIITVEEYNILKKLYEDDSEKFKKECMLISIKINESSDFIKNLKQYLETIIFKKFFKISTNQKCISSIDMVSNDFMSRRVSFSGTVNFYEPVKILKEIVDDSEIKYDFIETQLSDIISDDYSNGAIETAFFGIISSKTTITKYTIIEDTVKMELDILKYIKNNNTFNALIDVGGLFLKIKTIDIVKSIYNLIDKDRVILFIDNNDIKRIYSSESNNYKKYNNEVFENVFIYYDNKHCVGTDFKQPFIMKGLVIISENNTLTQVSQAIYRLRNINIGHSIEFYIPDTINDIRELYKKLQKEEEIYKESTHDNAIMQCVKYINNYKKKNIDNNIYPTYYCLLPFYYEILKITNENEFNMWLIKKIMRYWTNPPLIIDNIKFKNIKMFNINSIKTNLSVSLEMEISENVSQNKIYDNDKAIIHTFTNGNCKSFSYIEYFNDNTENNNYIYIIIKSKKLNNDIFMNYILKISLFLSFIFNLNLNLNAIIIYGPYYIFINISKKYILLMTYRELAELFINDNIYDIIDEYIVLDIFGNNIKSNISDTTNIEIIDYVKIFLCNNNIKNKIKFEIINKFITNSELNEKMIYLMEVLKEYFNINYNFSLLKISNNVNLSNYDKYFTMFYNNITDETIKEKIRTIVQLGGNNKRKKYIIIKK